MSKSERDDLIAIFMCSDSMYNHQATFYYRLESERIFDGCRWEESVLCVL